MAFWDGQRWVHPSPDGPARPTKATARDWVATFAMVVVVIVASVPFLSAAAGGPSLSTSPSKGAAGSQIAVSGTSFPAKGKVQLTWDGSTKGLPTPTVSAKGTFNATMTVPSGSAGAHTIAAVQLLSTGGKGKAGLKLGAVVASAVFTLSTVGSASASPVPTPSPTPPATPTPAPTATPTPKPSATAAPTSTPTSAPTSTPTSAPTSTPTPASTATPPPTPTPTPAPASSFVTACGTQLCLNGATWYLYGASQLGGLDDPAARASLAVAGGLNTLRIVNFLDEGGASSTAPYDEWRWQRVDKTLDAARANGLHVLLDLSTYRNLLWNAGANPYTTDWAPFLDFVANRRNTVNGRTYANDPTIAIVAFAGEVEPINTSSNTRGITTSQVTTFFHRTFAEWKALDPNHLTSSGGFLQIDWNSGIDWKTIWSDANSDVCSIHDYSNNDQTITTPAVSSYCGSIGRPWITEEFGWDQSTGDATRAQDYAGMYALQRTFHAAGVGNWNLGTQVGGSTYDVNPNTPKTWAVVLSNAP